MRRRRILILLAWLAAASLAQTKSWSGTWSATAGGRALTGTWDAVENSAADTASGTWTLTGSSGAPLAAGAWAARKNAKNWQGRWQARTANGQTYSGTWRAQVQLSQNAPITAMFQAALNDAIQGTWQMDAASGAWSIRAYSH